MGRGGGREGEAGRKERRGDGRRWRGRGDEGGEKRVGKEEGDYVIKRNRSKGIEGKG